MKLAFYIRNILPGFITIILMIIGSGSFMDLRLSSFIPLFSLIAVFFWSIYQPSILPNFFIFLLGVFQDIIYSMPLGISSLLLLIMWWVITSQRRFLIKEPFMIIWLMFIICSATYFFLHWILSSIYLKTIILDYSLLVQPAFTFLFYPCMHLIFDAVNKIGQNTK